MTIVRGERAFHIVFCHYGGVVGRSSVDDDMLQSGIILTEHAVESGLQELLGIVCNGDQSNLYHSL